MPSYIGFTPQFNPLSLQEVLAVPTMILGEYAKAEDDFENYQDKAAQLEAMVGEDPYGKAIINNYRNQLQNTANTIGDKGIQNAEGLRQALGVRRYYRENLMPLEVGIPYWEQYKKAKLALGEDPLEDHLTLESFIKNPAQAYSLTKGSDVRNLAATMAKAASLRRVKDPEFMGKVLNGTQYRTKYETGISEQEVQDWLNGNANPELDEIQSEVQKQFGNISPEKLDRFIKEGVYLGTVYDKKFEDKKNPYAEQAIELDTFRKKAEIQAGNAGGKEEETTLSQDRTTFAPFTDKVKQDAYDRLNNEIQYTKRNGEVGTITGQNAYLAYQQALYNYSTIKKIRDKREKLINDKRFQELSTAEQEEVKSKFNARYKNFNWTENDLNNAKSNLDYYKEIYKKTGVQDKDFDLLGLDKNNYENSIGAITGVRVLTKITTSGNSAGISLKKDMLNDLFTTLEGSKSTPTVKTLDGESIPLWSSDDKDKKQKKALISRVKKSDGTYGYNAREIYVSPESIKRGALVVQSPNDVSKGFNAGYVPVEDFGGHVVDAINRAFKERGVNPDNKEAVNAYLNKLEKAGLTQMFMNIISDNISDAFNYNFYQHQGYTKSE